jgi:TPR repeat protein
MRLLFQILLCCTTIVPAAALSTGADLEVAQRAYQEKDYITALKECTPLAEHGNAVAQLLLGRMYLMGQGVTRDNDQAGKWFEASATQGNADAQFMLGSMYLLPQKDVSKGVNWLRLSADQGNQDAQYVLGKAYLHGLPSLPRDAVQAELWLSLAALKNLQFYKSELDVAENQMTPSEIASGRALAAAWKPKAVQKPQAGEVSRKDGEPKTQQH